MLLVFVHLFFRPTKFKIFWIVKLLVLLSTGLRIVRNCVHQVFSHHSEYISEITKTNRILEMFRPAIKQLQYEIQIYLMQTNLQTSEFHPCQNFMQKIGSIERCYIIKEEETMPVSQTHIYTFNISFGLAAFQMHIQQCSSGRHEWLFRERNDSMDDSKISSSNKRTISVEILWLSK